MKKELNQRGFTLIEVIVALLLFSLLMGSLWQFFGNTYGVYTQLDKKTNLDDEARLVSSFIREEIRLSDQVTILVKDSPNDIHPPITPKTTESSIKIKNKQLVEIKLRTIGAGTRKERRFLRLIENTSIKNDQGKYSLIYEANLTSTPISDKIENINVTREADSPIVEFECTLNKAGETQHTQKKVFSESLEYKEKYIATP